MILALKSTYGSVAYKDSECIYASCLAEKCSESETTWFLNIASQEEELSSGPSHELGFLAGLHPQTTTTHWVSPHQEVLLSQERQPDTLLSLCWRVLVLNLLGCMFAMKSQLSAVEKSVLKHSNTALEAGFCWKPEVYKFTMSSVAQVKRLLHWNVWTFNCICKLLESLCSRKKKAFLAAIK